MSEQLKFTLRYTLMVGRAERVLLSLDEAIDHRKQLGTVGASDIEIEDSAGNRYTLEQLVAMKVKPRRR